eukprot:Hpha_TRINITY_DN15162_c1_g11::TRINITY_DN15162_c1_g11_i1::g.128080::m.128080
MAEGTYRSRCSARGVEPSATVLRALSGQTTSGLRDLNANGANVGDTGVTAVLDVVKEATGLVSLKLADNGLHSQALAGIIDVCHDHPSLTSLDLSHNRFPIGGEPLLQLVSGNTRLKEVSLIASDVRPLFTKLIEAQVRRNVKGVASPKAATSPPVSVHVDVTAGQQSQQSPQASPTYAFGGFNFGGGVGSELDEGPAEDEEPDDDEDDKKQEDDAFDDEAQRQRRAQAAAAQGGARRKTVSSEVVNLRDVQSFKVRKVQKSTEDADWLFNHLETIHLFSHLEDAELREAADAMGDLNPMGRGDILVEEGSDGSQFIIIQEGELEVVRGGKRENLR